ncbi:MAG: DnaJ-like protein djlA [Pseudomonadota bacterium]|jgi:DnaJ like chaperone protein
MNWKGKLFGTVFGFFMAGPMGALIGATLGHQIDKNNDAESEGIEEFLRNRNKQQLQNAFFNTTFSMMGYVAKIDGVISTAEIDFTTRVMDEMRLSDIQRKQAIQLFDQGKQTDFPWRQTLITFIRECDSRKSLLFMFIEIQLQLAYSDGDLNTEEEPLLAEIARQIGLSNFEYQRIKLQFHARQQYEQQKQQWQQTYQHYQALSNVEAAYQLLGVKASDSDQEIKNAYRRLMSQNHPDKLAAQGLSEIQMNQAKEKTQQIRKAYETIKLARKL